MQDRVVHHVDVSNLSPSEAEAKIAEIRTLLANRNSGRARKLLVWYTDVAQLPPHKVDDYIAAKKAKIQSVVDAIPPHVLQVWVPVRDGTSRVELLNLE